MTLQLLFIKYFYVFCLPEVADEPVAEKPTDEKAAHGGSNDRDLALARVESEKRNSLIKAWEENEKTKAENKYITTPSVRKYLSSKWIKRDVSRTNIHLDTSPFIHFDDKYFQTEGV